jgi:hypothetical protein
LDVDRLDFKGWESVNMVDTVPVAIASEPMYLEVTVQRAVCIWWAYFWRHMVYGGVACLIFGFLEGMVGLGGKHPVLLLSSVLVLVPVEICVLGIVLHKRFRHFSIRLVATSPR